MKKTIFSALTLTILLFTACYEEQDQTNDVTQRQFLDLKNPGVSREDIVRIATKYGLQDSIAEGYHCGFFTLPEPASYPYMDPIYIDSFFASQARVIKSCHEFQIFEIEKYNIKSVADYFALIERVPSMYQFELKQRGGLEGYLKYKEDTERDYDVYMGEDNTIGFSPKGEPFEYGRKLNKD